MELQNGGKVVTMAWQTTTKHVGKERNVSVDIKRKQLTSIILVGVNKLHCTFLQSQGKLEKNLPTFYVSGHSVSFTPIVKYMVRFS